MTDAWDEVRIIAIDAPLKSADRAMLCQAADEFAILARDYLIMQSQLIESQAQRIALNDQLIEIRRKKPQSNKWSYSSGWMKVEIK